MDQNLHRGGFGKLIETAQTCCYSALYFLQFNSSYIMTIDEQLCSVDWFKSICTGVVYVVFMILHRII